jgi:formylglycine-generating enzyme required for sulfatase activity
VSPLHSLWLTLTIVASFGSVLGCSDAPHARPAPALNCPVGMSPIAGGTFRMGNSFANTVDGFCLDRSEVSVADYRRCVKAGTCKPPGISQIPPEEANFDQYCNRDKPGRDEHPVNCVTWQDAADYCAFVHKRLPAEGEWEYAARGGSKELDYPWGSTLPTESLACWNSSGDRSDTCKVASTPPAAFGLIGMAGNVSEWVADWFAEYPSAAARNYRGPERGTMHIARGASWAAEDPHLLRAVLRDAREAGFLGPNVGIRCAASK